MNTNDLRKRLAAIEAEKPTDTELERLSCLRAALADEEYKRALCSKYVKDAYGILDELPPEKVEERFATAWEKMGRLVNALEALTDALGIELTPELCKRLSTEAKEAAVRGHEAGPGSEALDEAIEAIKEATK